MKSVYLALREATKKYVDLAHKHGAWVHVVGAFGLWGRVSPRHAGYLEGVRQLATQYDVVLIFDEAQNIRGSGLEELRMLTNINSGVDELLQLILIGQPELRDAINRPELRQFKQRVAANYHLTAMGSEESIAYIRHLLRAAGGTGNEIADDALPDICAASQGTPRLINQLCNFAMVRAAAANENPVSRKTVTEVLGDGMFLPYRLVLQDENP